MRTCPADPLEQLHAIRGVEPEPPYTLRITYDDGMAISVELEAVIEKGGVYAPLADWDVFSQARPDSRGRAIVWPGDVDMCADALRIEGQKQGQREAG